MATYNVQHLHSSTVYQRPAIYVNPHHRSSPTGTQKLSDTVSSVESFHKSLPDYAETQLHALPDVAAELGVQHVFLKDESNRFGLPAFKILGASWAIHRAICEHLELPATASLATARDKVAAISAQGSGKVLEIVTSTEGNWGRACARMAKYLGVPATIYVPWFMSEYTQNLIRGEGADLIVLSDGSYDDTITAVQDHAQRTGSLMVMDVSWDGYEQIPLWVTEGYQTMLSETDRQVALLTNGVHPNTFFVSVGVGSWAHAVVSHYKALDQEARILAVEPDSAASLKESLHCGEITPIETGDTIMAGMNCGTTSTVAWPIMKAGIEAAVTVTDTESHESVKYLTNKGISVGPCGAATLAALRKWAMDVERTAREKMVIVLFSTEGWREYEAPK